MTAPGRSRVARLVVLTLYYLGIIVAVAVIHGGRHAAPPPFVYQGF